MARVLVVDDEPNSAQIAEIICQSGGHLVGVAGHGEDALDLLVRASMAEIPFELLLLDIQMPGLDGFQVAAALRQDREYRHLPIIAVTARASEAAQDEMRASGIDRVLTKPYKRSELLAVVHAVLAAVTP